MARVDYFGVKIPQPDFLIPLAAWTATMTTDARKCAAEQDTARTLQRGMEAKTKEFVCRSAEVYANA
jgi:hypothetical protein